MGVGAGRVDSLELAVERGVLGRRQGSGAANGGGGADAGSEDEEPGDEEKRAAFGGCRHGRNLERSRRGSVTEK
jgi:hypothetical protein